MKNVEKERRAPLPERVGDIGVIPDISAVKGVNTYEGVIGPLLWAETFTSHFIEMPPGLYFAPHTHKTESQIYTVKGEWDLICKGDRQCLKMGSLIWVPKDMEIGGEVPPDGEAAYILIFSSPKGKDTPEEFRDYLLTLSEYK